MHPPGSPDTPNAPSPSTPWRDALPYVAPFAAFLFFLAARDHFPFDARWEYPLRVILVSLVIVVFSRRVLSFRRPHLLFATLTGAAVFLLWIAPDLLFPAYRQHWLFSNSLLGAPKSTLPHDIRADAVFLLFRVTGSVVLVPILEELFWRAWLMRWLIYHDFRTVPFGAYTPPSFWITALLFAAEHGSYWDVGLLAGIIFNWVAMRTRSLGACILAHAVANALLALYVILARQWQYWL